MSLAERASIAEGARQRASSAAMATPAMQEAIHTELRGAHAPLLPAQAPARQQQQPPPSRQPAEVERASAASDLPRGGSPTSKVRARRCCLLLVRWIAVQGHRLPVRHAMPCHCRSVQDSRCQPKNVSLHLDSAGPDFTTDPILISSWPVLT